MPRPDPVELRRAALAVAVLHDLDVVPGDDGLLLGGQAPLRVGWAECRDAVGSCDPESDLGRLRLVLWLRARRLAADLPAGELRGRLAPAGLPIAHVLHPGPAWVRERVLGGALELGLAAQGLDPGDPDAVLLLPPPAVAQAGLDPDEAWPGVRDLLERLGAVAAQRMHADPRRQLRPAGPADAVTLLGSRALRAAIAGDTGGMAAVAVPARRRGWGRMQLVDPAFAPAVAAATDPPERGFPRPLLVTADEVVMVRPGGRPHLVVLPGAVSDPASLASLA